MFQFALGFLEVEQYCYVVVNTVNPVSQVNVADNNAYCNYIQDLHCIKALGCNYTVYMEQVIDKLCQMQVDGLKPTEFTVF